MPAELDSLISRAAPRVTPPHPHVQAALADLVAATEREAASAVVVPLNRQRARVRAALGGLAAVALLGAGAGASAAGVLPAPRWAPWYDGPHVRQTQTTTPAGDCRTTYGLKAIEDPGRPATAAERDAALDGARTFLASVDVEAIDVARAVAQIPETAVVPGWTRAEREGFAIQLWLQDRLDRDLSRRGLVATVSVSMMQDCSGGGA